MRMYKGIASILPPKPTKGAGSPKTPAPTTDTLDLSNYCPSDLIPQAGLSMSAPVCSPDRPQRLHLPSSVYSRRARGHATPRRARETCFSAPRRFPGSTRCKRPRPAAPGPVCPGRLSGRYYPPLRGGSIGVTWCLRRCALRLLMRSSTWKGI